MISSTRVFLITAAFTALFPCVAGTSLCRASAQTPAASAPGANAGAASPPASVPASPEATVTAVPAANQPLSLTQAVAFALTNPAQRFKWQVQQDQANQAVSLASANLLPQFSTVTNINLIPPTNVNTPDATGTSVGGERARIGLAATYAVFNDGLLIDQRKIAQAEALATSANIETNQLAVVNLTVSAYFALLEAQRAYDSQTSVLASAAQLYKTAQVQYQVGNVAKVDVLTAQSTYESAVSQSQQAAYTLISARGTLAQTLGEDPIRNVPSAAASATPPVLSESVTDITSKAITAAPARTALVEQRIANRASLSAVRAQKSPSVGLSSGVGYTSGSQTGGYSYVTLNITAPLLNKQAQRAAERAAIDAVQLTDNAIQTTDYATQLTVLQDYNTYQSSFSQIDAAKISADAAAAALDLAQKEYAVGKGPLSQVETAIVAAETAGLLYTGTLDRRDSAVFSLEILSGDLSPATLSLPAASGAAPGLGGQAQKGPIK